MKMKKSILFVLSLALAAGAATCVSFVSAKAPVEAKAADGDQQWSMIGTPNWDTDTSMTYTTERKFYGTDVGRYELVYEFSANNEFKLRKDKAWTTSVGYGRQTSQGIGTYLEQSGENFKVKSNGIYILSLHKDVSGYGDKSYGFAIAKTYNVTIKDGLTDKKTEYFEDYSGSGFSITYDTNSYAKSGYYLEGLYEDAEFQNRYVSGSAISSQTKTLYAKYAANFDDETYYLVGSERGWHDVSTALAFTKVSNFQYKLENVSFVQDEEWLVRKGNNTWYNNSSDYKNEYVFPVNMTFTNGNVVVTASGASWNYNIYVEFNEDYSFKQIWVAFNLNVEKFCDLILSSTDSICAVNQGHNGAALKPVWKSLYEEFVEYPQCEKDKFIALNADEGGSQVEKAAYRYDYICVLYTTELEQSPKTYDYNFAGRTLSKVNLKPFGGIASIFSNDNSSNLASIVIIISITAVTSIAAFFVIKRRKEN